MPLLKFLKEIRLFLGIPRNNTSHAEKLISALGAGVGILVVLGMATGFSLWQAQDLAVEHMFGVYLIVASMGASAVLLFAVPHGALSQPWALIGGHLVSAVIGVASYQLFGHTLFSCALAVGVSVGAMYYLRCMHPPGGATALTAVVGGAAVYELGYWFLLVPVFLNILAILLIAILFNYAFAWRRYPAHLYFKRAAITPQPAATREFELTQEDLSAAILQHDSYIDITEEGLIDLLDLAKQHAELNVTHPENIEINKYYSNGKLGSLWKVWQVLDVKESKQIHASTTLLTYRLVRGNQVHATTTCDLQIFKLGVKFEVMRHKNTWIKVIT